jgi:hypothetical protein
MLDLVKTNVWIFGIQILDARVQKCLQWIEHKISRVPWNFGALNPILCRLMGTFLILMKKYDIQILMLRVYVWNQYLSLRQEKLDSEIHHMRQLVGMCFVCTAALYIVAQSSKVHFLSRCSPAITVWLWCSSKNYNRWWKFPKNFFPLKPVVRTYWHVCRVKTCPCSLLQTQHRKNTIFNFRTCHWRFPEKPKIVIFLHRLSYIFFGDSETTAYVLQRWGGRFRTCCMFAKTTVFKYSLGVFLTENEFFQNVVSF